MPCCARDCREVADVNPNAAAVEGGIHFQALLYRLAAYAMLNLLDDAAMLAMMFC